MNKNDEFYTLYENIENEISHYRFNNQIVFCNCDNPQISNFWKYFHVNFKQLKLKKLVCTYYDTKNKTYKMEYNGGNDNDLNDGVKTPLCGNGDFRSEECIKILKTVDIVVTNPPFSLFREYISQLIFYDKKFIILGNINSITYKNIFQFIKDKKLWFGYDFNKTYEFIMSDDYEIKGKGFIDKYNKKHGFVSGICWFTNLLISEKDKKINYTQTYIGNESKYPKYYNYDAINVDKISDIPVDYMGIMGVPITFLGKYNINEFKIVGNGRGRPMLKNFVDDYFKNGGTGRYGPKNRLLCYYDSHGKPVVPYMRILIQRENNKV